MTVIVQTEDFDVGLEINKLRLLNAKAGALVSFVGQVREFTNNKPNENDLIHTLTLEHYPGMTERALEAIEIEAKKRWNVLNSLIIHRVGCLKPLEQIVLVVVTSAHREDAFKACEFMMDYLKTQAPFWKKELTPAGERWVDARLSDDAALKRWQQ